MLMHRRQLGIMGAENLDRSRRLTATVMETLSHEPTWKNPFERMGVHVAVGCCVAALIQAGEASDGILQAVVLKTVRGPSRSISLAPRDRAH